MHCFDLKGNLKWQKDLGKLKTANGFGEGNSPAIHGNTLVVNWDHEGEDFIAAFDKTTGKYSVRVTPDPQNPGRVTIVATDEYGNQTVETRNVR